MIRHSGTIRAIEMNLAEENEDADSEPDTTEPEKELVADLTQDGQQFVLCKGGRGGLGNRNFATGAPTDSSFRSTG